MNDAAEIIAAAIEEHTSSMSYSFPEDDALVILDALRKHDYTLVRMGRADHVHLARQADRTVTVTPMRRAEVTEIGVVAEIPNMACAAEWVLDGVVWVDEVSS